MHQLLHPWWLDRAEHRIADAQPMREQLFTTALQEMEATRRIQQRGYDPIPDPRFRWAVQYLERIEGARRQIDPDIHITASLQFDPTPFLSRKDLAANES